MKVGSRKPLVVLCVCTYNRTRSVLMGGLLDGHLTAQDLPHVILTAGTTEGGQPPMDGAVGMLADVGIDVSTHVSRPLDERVVTAADLIVTAERDHVVWVAGQWPGTFERTYTLPEFVTRASPVGPRNGVPWPTWLAWVGADRPSPVEYLDDPVVGEIVDPTGHSRRTWEAVFDEVDMLTARVAALVS